MEYKYLKIFFLAGLFFIVVIVFASIKLNLFGATIAIEENASSAAKKEIAKIFYQEKTKKIDSIMQIKAKRNYFNGNVLVAYKGVCIYNQSFGYADLYRRKELKKDDVFQLASVSKQFTAMAIMILKERNQLAYDDSVTKYIPEFPYPEITIRMLLNHTAGLPNYYWLVEHHWKGGKAPNNEEIIKLMAEQKLNLYFTPGKRWDYSNAGYVVLASIVESISKQSFADFMHDNIFAPLEMENSFVYCSSNSSFEKEKLIGYVYRGRRYRTIPETVNDGAVGDKGVYSTTEDLFKWDQALYQNKLVSKATMDEAISTFKLRNRYEIPYGFGFRIRKRNDKKIAYHHGKWNGFRTSLLRYVEDTNTVIVLNHTSSSLNYDIIREIQNVLDDSLNTDVTYDVLASFLDEGIESAVECYNERSSGETLVLDTAIISRASKILYDTNNPAVARKLAKLNELYINGKLDTVLNDKNFLSTLILNIN